MALAVAAGAAVPSLRDSLIAEPVTPDLGGATTRMVTGDKAFTLLAANAQKAHQRPFFFGNRLFNTNWTIAPGSVASFDGLGPTFNRVSCSGCHVRDGRGRPPVDGDGPMESMLVRLSGPDGLPHPAYGDQLNDRAIPGVAPEGRTIIHWSPVEKRYADGTRYSLRWPRYEVVDLAYGPLGEGAMLSPRVAPAVIGLGLLEAVPEATLEALADPDDADGDGISGRVNRIATADGGTVAGRFGWKANVATLREQNAGAALGDIGITTPLSKGPNCQPGQAACLAAASGGEPEMPAEFLDKLTLYTRLLAVPAQRDPDDPQVRRGEALFRTAGCAACHVPTLRTGPDAALPELASQTFHPFTDLLLHDMGPDLADGRPDHAASGSEWRTPPLWGIGLIEAVNGHTRLLHDGRARSVAEAILWHGGEGEAARERFRSMEAADRAALLAFVSSL
ncbi:MAG: di-heme oxidoredictase family protein [Geminicoccaceae bacterium]